MKIAICLCQRTTAAERTVADMVTAQQHEAACGTRLLPFAFGCVGLVGRPDEVPTDWLVWEGADGTFLAFAGLPLAPNEAASGGIGASTPLVQAVLSGVDPEGTRARLGALDGAFVAVWWSAVRRELTLVTDFFGMQPLYRAVSDDTVLFASEVKAIARAATSAPTPDAGAWGAMLSFGHQIGSRSLLRGATRVPSAHVAVFTSPESESTAPTWQWPERNGGTQEKGGVIEPSLRDRIGTAVRADIAAYATAYPDASLLLSGGFDSRLILCLCGELGLKPRLLVQSHPDQTGDADARFAVAFARTVGIRPRVFPARAAFFSSDDYLHFLVRNEVATPSLDLFIPTVAAAIRDERHGVWDGLMLDPALKFDYGEGGFEPYLEKRTGRRRRAVQDAMKLAFAPAWREQIDAEYDALLAAERSQFTDDADGVWRFSVMNRHRFRIAVNPYQVYDTVTQALTPGMSRRLWEIVASIDPRLRFGKRLYRAVFEHLAPDGFRVPIASGTALLRGRGGMGLYHAQRARAAAQRVVRRPRVSRFLHSAGLPVPFVWSPSRFLDVALGEAALDDPRLNADWIRSQRTTPAGGSTETRARALIMYWQAWHHVMRGDLIGSWGEDAAIAFVIAPIGSNTPAC